MHGPERIRTLIAQVRRRWFATMALRAIGQGAAAAAAPTLAAGLVYWILKPEGGALLAVASVAAALALAGLVLVVRTIERRPDDRRVARFIEERTHACAGAAMDDCVVSAVQAMQLPPGDPRAALSPLVVGAAVRRLEGIAPAALVSPAELRRTAAVAASGLLVLGATLTALAHAITHVAETAQLRLFPRSVTVDVVPGDTRIVAGQPLRIAARVHARGGELSRVQPTLVVSAGGEERTVVMHPSGEVFEFAFESVDRSFTYKVRFASASSPEYTVTALFPPRVRRIDVEYQYPSFSGLKPRTDEDAGDIYAPAGTRVRLRIEADKAIASGDLSLSGGSTALSVDGDRTLQAELVLARDDSYRIRLLDRDGLRSDGDSEYFIRLMDDRPPDVRILRPSADQSITPLEEVSIEARAEDDYGISRLDLVYSVAGGKERTVPFAATTGTETQRTGSYVLAAEDLQVRPGDVITYYARARDVGRGKRPTETKSDIFFLEVRPFNAEFEAAQSQAAGGAGSGDPQLDALIAAQKEIISATWNVERRAAAGRSEADIEAIAQAQADLRARVERLLAGSRRPRGGERLPQDVVQRAPSRQAGERADPIAAAADAMTRAVEQLTSAKTRDALPHEMAALNGLLQAQAEVRRQQVMQQQANASGRGWGNRQSQDLSALFDKELQRQQRTNYEQRSRVEERQEQAGAEDRDLLDRIRDLARRQEELNRKQRELERMSAEERKRQLERLMREQEELQREAEQLSGPTGRAAADEMRRAASDLQRQNSEGAARSGERAAEQLRRAEQQARGGGADAQQRAAADLRAEAQQIAQEQRRIAAEAERLEKSGEANTEDARRRLAADKDRLADRVEAMQRAAERLGRESGTGNEPARAREAAGELERSRVGERMRESADAMREGSQEPSGERERELAQRLDQALDKLGGGASGEARTAAKELERTRELRDRLDRLEAGMRAAEGGPEGEREKLRQQYEQELRRARASVQPQRGGEQRSGAGATPEAHEYSRSAPGTEAFKQDRGGWETLRRDVNRALEEHDAAVSRRLAKALAEDRLAAGGSERVPEQYRRLVSQYFEALARARK